MARTIDDLRSEANRPVEAHATMTERDGMQAIGARRDMDAAWDRGESVQVCPENTYRNLRRVERSGGRGGATIDRDRDLG